MNMKCLILFLALIAQSFAERKVEVFVCLCDNEHQAIAKVGAKIGNGMDPAGNLYWGCSDGLSSYFKRSKKWHLISTKKHDDGPILITLNFNHHSGRASLIAHAYRGDKMSVCLETYFQKALTAEKGELVAFIGHNGMMDNIVTIPKAAQADDIASETIVLGCLTASYFTKPLKAINSEPLLLTKSLMYPGSFLLHDALEVWLRDGTKKEIREAAAKAYAKNQKISIRGARTVFPELD
ncbi:hypothetical protein N9A94_05450 [Akkermansiaceae bacterium]|nr:hypothetical protein [Akkermansiaceae bacterium]